VQAMVARQFPESLYYSHYIDDGTERVYELLHRNPQIFDKFNLTEFSANYIQPAAAEQATALVMDLRNYALFASKKYPSVRPYTDDAAQDVYVKLLELDEEHYYDPKLGPIGGWLYKFVMYTAFDIVKKSRDAKRRPADSFDHYESPQSPEFNEADYIEFVRMQFGDDAADLFERKYICGQKTTDIATSTGKSLAATRKALTRLGNKLFVLTPDGLLRAVER
jgi:DNA-directed RNA polymerase specialized sigma24 family protein